MARNVLQSSLLSAGFSIIFQILCRIITFGINAFIVRNVGRDVLGIMNVRLLLLESTLLFLSREAINRAALSSTTQQREKCSWAQLVNQIWLTVPICSLLCIPCVYIWLNWLTPVDAQFQEQYAFGCYAIAFSCVLELCAEICYFSTQVFCFVKLRILVNTLHIVIRSLVFLKMVIGDHSIAIYAFSIAQLTSAVTIICSYYGFFYFYIANYKKYKNRKHAEASMSPVQSTLYANMEDFPFASLKQMLPGQLQNKEPIFNSELQTLTISFVKQGVLKQILTEGEKYVMSMSPVLTFSEQATYDVVNNLGSLAARFIFRPIEDSSYFYFTQTIARDVELAKQERSKVLEAGKVLQHLTLVVTSIGLLALTFGQSYAHLILRLYGGADFVADTLPERLFQWHCLAICFLALNGITEGYMFATNTSQDIDKYNYLMAIFSICFLVLSYILTSIFGPVGFIFANCINMLCRICYSIRFIWRQFQPISINPLLGLMPGKLFGASLLLFGIFCKYLTITVNSMLLQFCVGALCVVLCLFAWCFENRELAKLAFNYVANRKKRD